MMPAVLKKIRFEDNSATPDYLQLVRKIEHLIRSGKLTEGQRLPTTAEMVNLWEMNIKRIQRAMDVLVSTGLIQRFPKRGTFVSMKENRPVIGIMVGPDLLPEGHQFHRLLVAALVSQITEKGLSPRVYDSLKHSNSQKWKRSHDELAYDFRHRSFGGVVLLSFFGDEGGSQDKLYSDIVKKHDHVSFATPQSGVDFHIDYADFARVSVLGLAKAGCRKIAYFPPQLLSAAGSYSGHMKGFHDTMASCGLTVPAQAILTAQPSPGPLPFPTNERIAYSNMERILREWKRKKYFPDAIVLADDINARGIIAAIENQLKRGQKPPEFVVLTMKGAEHFYVLPAARYSVSALEIGTAIMDRLSQKMFVKPVQTTQETIKGVWIDSFR